MSAIEHAVMQDQWTHSPPLRGSKSTQAIDLDEDNGGPGRT